MKIIPLKSVDLLDPVVLKPFSDQSDNPQITGRGDCKRCSREKVEYFVRNWDKILPPKVIKSVKKHGDVMHGARSVNMIVGKEYSRRTKDFDIYSKRPKTRAEEIEDAIDKACGCDMAYVYRQPIPKMNAFTEEDKFTAKELYIVKTVPNQDGDVDYMKIPKGLPTHTRKGIKHENLSEALRKAKKNLNHPLRAQKASVDIKRINAYLESRKRRRK